MNYVIPQPYSADLSAIAALSGDGFLSRAGGDWLLLPSLQKSNLPASVAYRDEANVWTQNQTFNGNITVNNGAVSGWHVMQITSGGATGGQFAVGDFFGERARFWQYGLSMGGDRFIEWKSGSGPDSGTLAAVISQSAGTIKLRGTSVQARNVADNADAPFAAQSLTLSGGGSYAGYGRINGGSMVQLVATDGVQLAGSNGDALQFLATGANKALYPIQSFGGAFLDNTISLGYHDQSRFKDIYLGGALKWKSDNTAPLIKNSGTTVQFRLGNDLADAPISASSVTAGSFRNSVGVGIGEVAGYLGLYGFNTLASSPTVSVQTDGTRTVGKAIIGAATYWEAFGSETLKVNGAATFSGAVGAASIGVSGNLSTNDFFLSRFMYLQGGSGPRISNSGNTVQLRNNVNSADADLALGALTASGNINQGGLAMSSTAAVTRFQNTASGYRYDFEFNTPGLGGRINIGAIGGNDWLTISGRPDQGNISFRAGLSVPPFIGVGAQDGGQRTGFVYHTNVGVELVSNNGANDPILRWGSTASFPALKRSGTTLQVRLADDSAMAPFEAGAATFSGNITASSGFVFIGSANGFIRRTDATNTMSFAPATNTIAGHLTLTEWVHEGGWFNSRSTANFAHYLRMGYNSGSPTIEATAPGNTLSVVAGTTSFSGAITASGTIGFTGNHVMRRGTYNGEIAFGNSGTNFFYLNGNSQRNTVLSGGSFGWSSSASVLNGDSAIDTTISRSSGGVVQIGTTSNNALGSLNLANLTASGSLIVSGGTVSTDGTTYFALRAPDGQNMVRGFSMFGRHDMTLGHPSGWVTFPGSVAFSGSVNPQSYSIQSVPIISFNTPFSGINFIGRDGMSGAGGDIRIRPGANVSGASAVIINSDGGLLVQNRAGNADGNLSAGAGTFSGNVGLGSDTRFNRPSTKTLATQVFESSLSAWQETERHQASPAGALWAVFGATPIAKQTLPAAATDAATTQTLANAIRTLLIDFGFSN